MDLLETRSLWITYITCDVFIICLDSHSDGTHSTQKIHWRSRLISQNLFQWMNKVILDDLTEGKTHFQQIFFLGELSL